MRLYKTRDGTFYGTQAEAKKADKKFQQVEVPTDKAGLIKYLNKPPVEKTNRELAEVRDVQRVYFKCPEHKTVILLGTVMRSTPKEAIARILKGVLVRTNEQGRPFGERFYKASKRIKV